MKNITIFGNLAKDCEERTGTSGTNVCNFDIAVNDRRTKETYWFSCGYWGNRAKSVAPYLKKGQPVIVSGEFSWREYNQKKYLQINVDSLTLAGKAKEQEYTPEQTENISNNSNLDDDIPF